jgi:hypothetical protein
MATTANTQGLIDSSARTLPTLHSPGNAQESAIMAGTQIIDNVTGEPYAPQVTQIGDRSTPAQAAAVDTFGNLSMKLGGVGYPVIVQKGNAASTGSVASLAKAFTTANTAGNTIVVVAGCGNGTAMTVADTLGNTYVSAVAAPNSTTFASQIFYAAGVLAGTNTVTVTNAGTTASMAMEIYEVSGLLAVAAGQPDYTSLSTGTSATPSAPNHAPSLPNSIAFMGVAVGTAAQAVSATASSGWTLDSTQNTTTPAGLYTFGALSAFLASTAPITPKATLAGSEPYAIAAAVFRPVALPITGIVTQDGYNYTHFNTAQTNTIVKTGSGILHALILNTAVASATFEYDDAITHTNAMGIFTLPGTLLASNGYYELDVRFNTGLAITSTGTADWTVVWK